MGTIKKIYEIQNNGKGPLVLQKEDILLIRDDSKNQNVISDLTFEYVQGIPSNHWIVNHNLNKNPSVTITDNEGSEYEADVKHIDINNVEIYFSVPFSGKATFN